MADTREYQELSEESKIEQQRHADTLKQYETSKRARSIVVPTAVDDVKAQLRHLGQPITLFGEDHADRRERLREILARIELGIEDSAPAAAAETPASVAAVPAKQREAIYSPACEELISFRQSLAEETFRRSQLRLAEQRLIAEDESRRAAVDQRAASVYAHSRELVLHLSQLGDERPLSTIKYATDGTVVASGSFSPTIKLWNAQSLGHLLTLRGHTERVTSISWQSPQSSGSSGHLLASASADGSCMLWDCTSAFDGEQDADAVGSSSSSSNREALRAKCTLRGHSGVLSAAVFHPFKNVVGTASHDQSWRLWDVPTGKEILLQDAHLQMCSGLAFHVDGSLAASTDSGGVILLWDLRSGQMIQSFQGHIKKITAVDFQPVNGFQLATCSLDNTVKIWDLRKRKCAYTLPAHSNVLTDVKFSSSGELLLTASFDASLKLWRGRDFQLLRTLTGHNGKIMAADVSPDEKHVISAGYDRTIKLWAHKNEF